MSITAPDTAGAAATTTTATVAVVAATAGVVGHGTVIGVVGDDGRPVPRRVRGPGLPCGAVAGRHLCDAAVVAAAAMGLAGAVVVAAAVVAAAVTTVMQRQRSGDDVTRRCGLSCWQSVRR